MKKTCVSEVEKRREGICLGGGLSVHLIKSNSNTVPLAVKQWPLILSVD